MHTLKVAAFALSALVGFAGTPSRAADAQAPADNKKPVDGVRKVDVEEFDKARQAKDVVVLDVRSPEEYAAGHVPGAVNVPVSGKGSEAFDKSAAALAKDKTVLVYCKSGVRSARAVEKLRQMGAAGIVEMPRGWVGWSEAGKPFERGSGERQGK